MDVRIVKEYDHTLKRKGDVRWYMETVTGEAVKVRNNTIGVTGFGSGSNSGWNLGCFKTRKALMDQFNASNDGFYEVVGQKEIHMHYSHWAGLSF